ncbi:hypothetical protein GCM10023329_57690 [Streptomyces sanyensis]|uniref:Uncharacterized protein n=1 Tax=Streptomyces sanyensis TaxID=568869 RepID=A0ABP9BLM2_9ACTN
MHGAVHSPERVLVPGLCREHGGGQLRVVPQHYLNLSESQLVTLRATLREPARYVLFRVCVHA